MSTSGKYRYWAFEVYEESAPKDWERVLKDSHGSYAISPKHEPSDDQKPHYHVIYRHSNPITKEHAKAVIPETVPANGHIEPVNAPRNYQRYLIHLDDPDKQQFKGGPTAIKVLNGFPLDLSRDYSKAELQGFREDIFELIQECNMTEYSELLDYLRCTGEVDLFDYAANKTILYNTYLTSRRNKLKAKREDDEE